MVRVALAGCEGVARQTGSRGGGVAFGATVARGTIVGRVGRVHSVFGRH
jgi:hypothetical protein